VSGQLQHSRVLLGKGFHWASRQHFLTGIFGYLTSPLWLLQLLIGIVIVFPGRAISDRNILPANLRSFRPSRGSTPNGRSNSSGLTMGILLAPKMLGLIVAIYEPETRKGSGGVVMLLISTLFEIVLSALLAPIMMLIQTGHVLHIVFGFDTGWDPQRRDEGSVPFADIVRRHIWHVALGLLSLVAGFAGFALARRLM
jgi:membrane glycosyltransferase